MKRFLFYSIVYLLSILAVNYCYSDFYGNAIFLLTILLGLGYNLLVIYKTKTVLGEYGYLSAGFVAGFICFFVYNGGIVPLMYVKDLNFIEANNFGRFLTNAMLMKFVSVAAVANVFYWIGYRAKLGDYLFSFYYEGLGYKRFFNLEIGALFPKILIVLGFFLNFVLLINGAFGRNEIDPDKVSLLIQVLNNYSFFTEKLALIGYFLLALIYFRTKEQKSWFIGTLIGSVFFALLYGARGPIIFLFILTLLPYYFVHKKIKLSMILGGVLTLVFAFTLAAEMKLFTKAVDESNVSIENYYEAYTKFKSLNDVKLEQKVYGSVYYNIMQRLNDVAQGSIAINYKDTRGLAPDDPPFLSEMYKIPLHTFVPRSKFLGTQFPAWGNWFRLKVLGFSDSYHSNTSFGIVGFFYMTGNWIFVIVGFFIYGTTLRFTNNILKLGTGLSFLVYLAIISAIAHMGTSIPSGFVSFFRFSIFLPIFFYIMIKTINSLRL